jgi:uncharacterized protein with PIN domain
MKNQTFQTLSAVMSIAATAFLTYSVSADPIKGAQLLLKRPTASNSTSAAAVKPHDCAMCQDVTKVVKTASNKGAYAKTTLVAEHMCPSCNTRIETVGQGKAAHSVAQHTCALGRTPSCCQ